MGKRLETVRNRANRLMSDDRGQTDAAGKAVEVIVGLMVASLMAAYLLPMAINEIASVSTSSWGNGAGALWGLMPVMIVLAIFLYMVGMALNSADF